MRDHQTGTYWQQISGRAISGPLAGNQLELVSSDELTYGLWKREQPRGTVLQDIARYASDYSPLDWDKEIGKMPPVISYPQAGIKSRDIMLGVRAFGSARAFPFQAVLRQKLIQDHVGDKPILIVVGPDNQSVRVFVRKISGRSDTPDFYRSDAAFQPFLMDSFSGSEWNFQGCAVAGSEKGACLTRIDSIKDYWFDWRNNNADTSVFGLRAPVK